MAKHKPTSQAAPFEILGKNNVNSNWNGAPLKLEVNDHVDLPQTPAGSMIFTWENVAKQNNLGQLMVTSGGDPPVPKRADANANRPEIWIHNWNANNLGVTNVSANSETPIRIQAVGVGIPGTRPEKLRIGKTTTLKPGSGKKPGQSALGDTSPSYMQLVIRCPSSTQSVVAFIGGPQDKSGNNGYAVIVNADENTGPKSDPHKDPPPGYYATTTSNQYTHELNAHGGTLFVVNLSAETATPVDITLRQL